MIAFGLLVHVEWRCLDVWPRITIRRASGGAPCPLCDAGFLPAEHHPTYERQP